MREVLSPWANPVTYGVPFFLLAIAGELLALKWLDRDGDGRGYLGKDWLPLPLLGVPPWALYVAYGFNLVYQFFVHTELVGKLPRPIEFVFNTPSHHRVHHGSDAIYLDRNYGGILILWDRAFRTFQGEAHRPVYGLTIPVDTYNLITLQYGAYAELWRDIRLAGSWRDRLGYAFMPPRWEPAAASRAARTAAAAAVSQLRLAGYPLLVPYRRPHHPPLSRRQRHPPRLQIRIGSRHQVVKLPDLRVGGMPF